MAEQENVLIKALLESKSLRQYRNTRLENLEGSAFTRYKMNNVPPAFVLNWTSTGVDILCPFPSCDQKVHHHGYSMPTNGRLNTTQAHCDPRRKLEYRLLFPYEDDLLVRNFGFLLDRQKMMWTSVAEELDDPRIDKEGELLCTKLARTRTSEPGDQYVLDGEETRRFLSECVNRDLVACKRRLETSERSERLVKGKDPRDGKTALSCVCEEGHLEIVELLCQHGADLESVDNKGHTPIMLATLNGHGKTAYYLAQLGASLFVMDNNGITMIEMAKTAFQELNELEWSKATIPIYSSGMGSPNGMEQVDKRNAALRRIKERKEGLRHVIDLYMALKPERNIQRHALTERKEGNTFSIVQLNETNGPRVLFNKTLFETTMAKENKAFAFLDRGRPFEHIQATAVSGYTAGECGNDDGCLDRNLWTSRVMEYCKVIGHELQRVDQYGRTVSEISQACHAEKQLMAYFLWMHTTLDQDFEDSNDDGEIWGNCYQIGDLGTCKPNVASMKKDVYVSREPCCDCTRFQKRLHEKAGIFFNLFFIKPIYN